MEERHVLISYRIPEDDRKMFKDMLEGRAKVTFIKDYPPEEHPALVRTADVIICWKPWIEIKNTSSSDFENVKFIQLLSAGYDDIDFNIYPKDCIISANQGAYAEPMAEHILAMILALAKRLMINHKDMTQGGFNTSQPTKSLKDSICGIIGLGGTGKAVAKLLRAFGAKIYAINSTGRTTDEVEFIGTLNDLDNVLKSSDELIISIPLSDRTKGLIGKRELNLMKPDAILINAARGEIINEKDLYEHLVSNPNFYAGIDTWWNEPSRKEKFKTNYPFFDLPNLLGSPHNSGIVPGSLLHAAKYAAENVIRFITGKKVERIIKN